MRNLILSALAFCLLITPANAETVVIQSGQTYEIIGPYQNLPFIVTYSASLVGNPSPPPGNILLDLNVFANAVFSNGQTESNYTICESVFGGTCAGPDLGLAIINGPTTVTGFAPGGFILYAPSLSSAETEELISIPAGDAVFTLNLPDGYSVAAIPEPSTWAMLLIGFAGVGFLAHRRRARHRHDAAAIVT